MTPPSGNSKKKSKPPVRRVSVAILMGSKSDRETLQPAVDTLKEFGVGVRIDVASAHRSPAKVERVVATALAEGVRVFICAAGHAAHLGGVVAAATVRPVIGVPIASSDLSGWDALLSIAMMPPGVPVSTMALGKAGARNAALTAIQILALSDAKLEKKLVEARTKSAADIESIATERA